MRSVVFRVVSVVSSILIPETRSRVSAVFSSYRGTFFVLSCTSMDKLICFLVQTLKHSSLFLLWSSCTPILAVGVFFSPVLFTRGRLRIH